MGRINKYVILLILFGLVWLGFLGIAYVNLNDTDGIAIDEMHDHARHTGQQIHEVFAWFDEKRTVLVPESLSEVSNQSINPRILANNGLRLSMPLPISLARRLENQVQNGVSIRFVSDAPLNINNRSSSAINRAIMSAFDSGSMDAFEYNEQTGMFSYVRPITATSSCIRCHLSVPVGGYIGSMVIDINPDDFIHAERSAKQEMLLTATIGSFVSLILFYTIMFLIWRRKRKQSSGVDESQAIVANMSQDIEVALGNMSSVLRELGQCVDEVQRTELINSLKNINRDLLDTSFKLQAGDKRINQEEEIFHVEELMDECVDIFRPNCDEKGIELTLKVDPSVPLYLLGDAYHLKQALGRLVKYSVLYTNKGSVVVRVRTVEEIAATLNTKMQAPAIISLIIEIEDTGRGFMVTDKQSLLQGFAQSMGKSKNTTIRPIISLTPVNEIASLMNGSVTMPSNTKEGSCFRLVVQMKKVDEKQAVLRQQLQQKLNGSNAVAEAASAQSQLKGIAGAKNEQAPAEVVEELGPVSIILADNGINKLSDQASKLWNKEEFTVIHMTKAQDVCEALRLENHGFSAVVVRSVSDMEAIVASIKIRQSMPAEAEYVPIILLSESNLQTDMEVLQFFNISTAENMPRDAQIVMNMVQLALFKYKNKIFQGDNVFDKSYPEQNANKIFNMRRALEQAKNNQKMVNSKCSMWVHFYPTQMERTQSLISEGDESETLRLLQSLKNSANTVSLPLLYAEAKRLETKILNGKVVRYEKLLAVYEHTYDYMKEHFD